MSQWNNSYGYNNQYQGPNTWNSDPNSQYNMNQAYYPDGQFNRGNQYVSFNEFISQMQVANVNSSSASYSDPSYHNYGQTEVQNMPSTSQNPQNDTYRYSETANIPNGVDTYHVDAQNQYASNSNVNNMVFKSNLTATATEFVPKSSVKPSTSTQEPVPEPSTSYCKQDEVKSKSSSFDKNWRERPQTSQQNGASKYNNDSRLQDKDNSSKSSRNRESSSKYENNRKEHNNHNQDSSKNSDYNNSRNQDGYRNSKHESNRYQDSSSSSRNQDSRFRNNDSMARNQDNPKKEGRSQDTNYSSNDHRSDSYGRNNDNNESRSQERYDTSRNDRGQSKFNKQKNKDYSGQTFYNSSSSKGSQDVRSNKDNGRSKNYAGSQRVRPDNSGPDDEQYANTYLQKKEDRLERYNKAEKNSPIRNKSKQMSIQGNTDLTQRERLSDQLDKGTLECLVCCERVKQTDSVWSCSNCYHVLHLRCIRKWAISSLVEGKWRCPACQNTSSEVPSEYRCMCGAMRSPDYQRGGGAHTCGKACKRARACPHPCTLLCHPGPCPACQATVQKSCGCRTETRSVLCSSKLPQECGRVCDKTLECGVHKCTKNCHEGPCDACADTVTQVCYCPATKPRTIPCTIETSRSSQWSCGSACGRVLACGQHVCRQPCHAGDCAPCRTLPGAVRTCACGKTRIDQNTRKTCTDPIPLCGNICAKPLSCGPNGDKHFCKVDCHEGECPICPDKTLLQCRCGHSSREVPCAELPEMLNNVLCQKKCNKKLSCGRHRCRTVCCAATSHRCAVVCGRTLSCQTHRCEEFCHTGHCAPCPTVSFEELTCECGAEVILPPVRCGSKPPACSAACTRARACGHAPLHACHAGPCPPCVVLTRKRCYGDHEERKTIPCSQDEFSCGLPCGKPLPCGKHTCIKICHKGDCETGICTQPCTEKRPSCGHPCAAPCHAAGSACPGRAPCRRPVRATCACARRHVQRACADNARDLAKIMSTLAATKIQEGGSVDLSDVQRPPSMLKTLECDDECRVEARTRRLALALQIRNPDVSAKLAPRYSDHIRNTAAKEPQFAQQIHDKLTELVQLAKKSKQRTRAHSFPSMNWQKRQFIHELCEHFGCESVAYDAEPNRNVVATADKEKSWLPAMSVLAVLEREAGKRRIPGPVLRSASAAPAGGVAASAGSRSGSGWATLTSANAWAARSQAKPAEPKIDYFDNPPEN